MNMKIHAAAMAPSLLLSALCSLTVPVADAAAGDGTPDFAKKTMALSTGIEMKYFEAGNPDGDEVIVLLHGYTDSSRSFYPTVEALLALDRDFHIYSPDLRGHGGSSMPDGAACAADPGTCFEMADFASDLVAFMDAEDIESAHLVGHSMGSLIAQELALTHPGRVDSLVLIGTAASIVGNPMLEEFILEDTLQGDGAGVDGRWRGALEAAPGFGDWPRDAYDRRPLDADPHAESWMATNWVVEAAADPDFLRQIVPESARVRIGTWLGAAEALREVDNRAALARLEVDSLVLWAIQDVVVPAADQRALRAALGAAAAACRSGYVWKQYGKAPPPAEGQTDLGHNTQWGVPVQVAADIHAYLTTGRPTPDLYFADPAEPTLIRTEPGAARIIGTSGDRLRLTCTCFNCKNTPITRLAVRNQGVTLRLVRTEGAQHGRKDRRPRPGLLLQPVALTCLAGGRSVAAAGACQCLRRRHRHRAFRLLDQREARWSARILGWRDAADAIRERRPGTGLVYRRLAGRAARR